MRFSLAVALIAASASTGVAFVPSSRFGVSPVVLRSALEVESAVEQESPVESEVAQIQIEDVEEVQDFISGDRAIVPLTADEINARLHAQLEKLRAKDRTSTQLSKEDLKIVFEDDYIVVVDKPSGVLTVAGKEPNPSLAQAVYDAVGSDLPSADHMVVHRLGMDTSGLIVLAKNIEAVRGMNEIFRTRSIERQYEALVAGHVAKEEGLVSLPLMRDYEFPPYVRVSTYEHQEALLDLSPEEVGKKLLEGPKESLTKYQVESREEFGDQPVTRVSLTSISGRYHQLNAHLAAFGHPIVGDTVYGINGDAASNGGLTDAELETLAPNPSRAASGLQESIASAAKDMAPCVHANYLKFRHPITQETLELRTNSPF